MKLLIRGRKMKKGAKGKEKGFVLITSYMLVASLLTSVTGYFARSINDLHLAERRMDRLQALYASETGIDRTLEWLKAQRSLEPPWAGCTTVTSAVSCTPVTSAVSCTPFSSALLGTSSLSFGTYTAVITQDAADPQIYCIRSTGVYQGVQRETRVSVRIEPFTRYAYYADQIDSGTPPGTNLNNYFATGNTVTGPLHSNDAIRIFGSPVFDSGSESVVSSSASSVLYHNSGTASDGFTPLNDQAGYTHNPVWGVPPPAPPVPPLLSQPRKPAPPEVVSYFAADSLVLRAAENHVWFNGDGTISVSDQPITTGNPGLLKALPASGKIYYPSSRDPLVIKGVVDRNVTVASNNDIEIYGGLTYKDCFSPSTGIGTCGASGPKFGAIAKKRIIVRPEAWPVSPGEESLYLNGAFMALGGGMKADLSGTSGVKNLKVYGSVIEQKTQEKMRIDPVTGTITAGYRASYYQDPRMSDSNPTGFPTSVSVLSWQNCTDPNPSRC